VAISLGGEPAIGNPSNDVRTTPNHFGTTFQRKEQRMNDLVARVQSAFRHRQVEFLKIELETCSRSANLASMMYQAETGTLPNGQAAMPRNATQWYSGSCQTPKIPST